MFENLMKMYAEAVTAEQMDSVLDLIYANGYTESEVYDYCVEDGLL